MGRKISRNQEAGLTVWRHVISQSGRVNIRSDRNSRPASRNSSLWLQPTLHSRPTRIPPRALGTPRVLADEVCVLLMHIGFLWRIPFIPQCGV